MPKAAASGVDADGVGETGVEDGVFVGETTVAEVGVADVELDVWVEFGDGDVVVESAEHDVAVLSGGVIGGGAGVVGEFGVVVMVGDVARDNEGVGELARSYGFATFVEYVFLLDEVDLGAVVVVGEGAAFYFTVEDNGVDGAVEVGEGVALRVEDLTLDGDTGEDCSGVGDSGVDGHLVDVSDLDLVAGDREPERGVADECDAVRDGVGVFSDAEGVADGIGGVECLDAEVGVETLRVVNGAGGRDDTDAGGFGEEKGFGAADVVDLVEFAEGTGAGDEKGEAVGVGVFVDVGEFHVAFGTDICTGTVADVVEEKSAVVDTAVEGVVDVGVV